MKRTVKHVERTMTVPGTAATKLELPETQICLLKIDATRPHIRVHEDRSRCDRGCSLVRQMSTYPRAFDSSLADGACHNALPSLVSEGPKWIFHALGYCHPTCRISFAGRIWFDLFFAPLRNHLPGRVANFSVEYLREHCVYSVKVIKMLIYKVRDAGRYFKSNPNPAFKNHLPVEAILIGVGQDILNGDEIISDVYDLKDSTKFPGCWEVDCKMVTVGGEDFVLEGANASAEGEDAGEGVESTGRKEIDIVNAFRLKLLEPKPEKKFAMSEYRSTPSRDWEQLQDEYS